jgi:hypothetical protein
MPEQILTDTRLRTLKPKDKPYKVLDGTIGGLHPHSRKKYAPWNIHNMMEGLRELENAMDYPACE